MTKLRAIEQISAASSAAVLAKANANGVGSDMRKIMARRPAEFDPRPIVKAFERVESFIPSNIEPALLGAVGSLLRREKLQSATLKLYQAVAEAHGLNWFVACELLIAANNMKWAIADSDLEVFKKLKLSYLENESVRRLKGFFDENDRRKNEGLEGTLLPDIEHLMKLHKDWDRDSIECELFIPDGVIDHWIASKRSKFKQTALRKIEDAAFRLLVETKEAWGVAKGWRNNDQKQRIHYLKGIVRGAFDRRDKTANPQG